MAFKQFCPTTVLLFSSYRMCGWVCVCVCVCPIRGPTKDLGPSCCSSQTLGCLSTDSQCQHQQLMPAHVVSIHATSLPLQACHTIHPLPYRPSFHRLSVCLRFTRTNRYQRESLVVQYFMSALSFIYGMMSLSVL